jgi:hypothetical protein
MQIHKETVKNVKRIMTMKAIMMKMMILLTVMKIPKIAIQVKTILLIMVKICRPITRNNNIKYPN